MATIQGPLDVGWEGSEDFLKALGRLVAESALLESSVEWLIALLMGGDQRRARIVLAELDFRKKLNLVRTLIRESESVFPAAEDMLKLIGTFDDLYNRRNDYIHGQWGAGTTASQRRHIRATAKGKYKIVFTEIDAQTIETLAKSFNAAAAELTALTLGKLYPSS